MKSRISLYFGMAGAVFVAGALSTASLITPPPVYVPDTSRANGALPDGADQGSQ